MIDPIEATDSLGEYVELRNNGGAWLQFGDGGELHLLEFPVPEAKGQHFALRVDDMDDALATLADKGVVPERVGEIEGICRQAFLTEPSGNEIELNQPL